MVFSKEYADIMWVNILELAINKNANNVHCWISSRKAEDITKGVIKSVIPITDIESFAKKEELEEALDFISKKYAPYGVQLEKMEISPE